MTAPVEVVYVVHRSARNRLLNALLDELHPALAHIEVVVLDETGPMAADLAERGVAFTALGPTSLRSLLPAVRRIRSLLRRRPDVVVHSNGYLPGLAVELARVGLRRRPPSLLGRHHNREHHLVAPRHVRLDAWSARHASAVVVVSAAVGDTLAEEGVARHHVTVVPNGVDWERLEPSPDAVATWRDRLGTGPTAVAAGRLDPVKDHPTLLQALALARRSSPTLTLSIAGTGNDGAVEAVTAAAAAAGVADAVTLLGWVDDLPALLVAADVVVQSSLDESFGQVVLEAMGLGVPVAVTTPGGVAEVVGSWYEAVPPGAPAALAAAIEARVVDLAAARARAAEAAPDVRRRFSRTVMAEGHLALYRRLAGRETT